MYWNTANSTWFEENKNIFKLKCRSIFKNIFNSDESVVIFSVYIYFLARVWGIYPLHSPRGSVENMSTQNY